MFEGEKMGKRFLMYILGFLIMTLGIAISVKSNLGVSPVSSIPYTLTCVLGLEMGKATIVFHIALVLLQVIIMRRDFKIKNLLQIPAGIIFGYFTTFCNWLMGFVAFPDTLIIRIIMLLISTVLIALGLFFYVPANIIPLAGEGAILAFSDRFGYEFSNVKLVFDVSMVTISSITCLLVLKNLGSVGIGTIVAAFLVGNELKLIKLAYGRIR
ncbi:MAG: DUF6198 family protein [Muricomes sp.]|uniref:YczE/YyaS/YitT family protein n=1 Tax=Faecalicatena contorta TaxID=39482 RepID=UPI002EAD364E|nr:DUF6198 family protein [Muricomes sp.]